MVITVRSQLTRTPTNTVKESYQRFYLFIFFSFLNPPSLHSNYPIRIQTTTPSKQHNHNEPIHKQSSRRDDESEKPTSQRTFPKLSVEGHKCKKQQNDERQEPRVVTTDHPIPQQSTGASHCYQMTKLRGRYHGPEAPRRPPTYFSYFFFKRKKADEVSWHLFAAVV